MITYESEAKQVFEELLGTLTLLSYVSTLRIIHGGEVSAMKQDIDNFMSTFYKLRLSRISTISPSEEEKRIMLKALNTVVDELKKGCYTTLNLSTYTESIN